MSPSKPAVKTDNRSLALKLRIRIWAIEAAELTELHVWDLCAGEGRIWKELRKRYPVASYCPCDRRPRMPATLKGDVTSERFLQSFDVSRFNVIDLDTYGELWATWLNIAPRIRQKTAVFLTRGHRGASGGYPISRFGLRTIGIPDGWKPPPKRALADFANTYLLFSACDHCTIDRAARIQLPGVTYYGLVVGAKEPTEKAFHG